LSYLLTIANSRNRIGTNAAFTINRFFQFFNGGYYCSRLSHFEYLYAYLELVSICLPES